MEGNNNIGNAIYRHRQVNKMTQEEFASRLGVTPQAVSKWERGNGLPDISLIRGICKTLNMNANTLLGIESSVVENGDIKVENEIKSNLIAEPLVFEFGKSFISYIETGLREGYIKEYINAKRKELVVQAGILMPLLRMKDNFNLEENTYRILSYDKELFSDKVDDMDDAVYKRMIEQMAGVCKYNYGTIINKQIVKLMIDNLKEQFPGIADGLVPEKISYLQVERKLQEMIKRGESIRDLIHILEELEESKYESVAY